MARNRNKISKISPDYRSRYWRAEKKPRHAGPVRPVISKQKYGKMNNYKQEHEQEISDASNNAFLLLFKLLAGIAIAAALIKLVFYLI